MGTATPVFSQVLPMDCQEELLNSEKIGEMSIDMMLGGQEGHLYAMHMVRTQRGRQKISPALAPENTRHNAHDGKN